MDSGVIAAFANSASKTFKDMFGFDATTSGARELSGSEDHGWDITGLLGLAGQAQGIVAIRLGKALVSSLLASSGVATAGDDGHQLEGELVGEITNIIAGSAITAIHELDIQITPPVIIRGPNHKIGWPNIAPVVALSFSLPSGSFELDLCIKH